MRTRAEARRPTKSTEIKIISTKKNLQQATVQHETLVRTPKLMSPRSRNIAQTPGRDDVLCSQHFDSQMVVGWDCNSPDTLRGIKRISGPDHDDVSDLVMRLIGQETDDEVFTTKHSTPPLLGLWKEDSEDKLLEEKTVVAHRLRRNRGRQRRKSGKESAVSKDLLSKLSLALDKCAEVDEGEDQKHGGDELFLHEEDEPTKQHDCSDDLFNSESNDIEVKTRTPTRHLEQKNTNVEITNKSEENRNRCARSDNSSSKSKVPALDLKSCEHAKSCDNVDNQIERMTEVAEEDWSDDELFEEDSFIVKATQVSTEVKKFVSPVFGMKRKGSVDSGLPKSKCSRYSFQLSAGDEKDKHKHFATEKFTNLHIKNTGSVCSSLGKGNVLSVSKPQSGIVTKSDNRKPAVYQSALSSRVTCTYTKPNTGVQVFSSCANPLPINNGATYNQNMPLTRQRTCTSSNSVNSNCGVPIVSKPTNTQTSSTFTNLTFKKHNSFSGTGSQNLVLSRRRSVSGDKHGELPTGVKNFYGGTTGYNPVKNTTARTYPSVSVTCMTSNSIARTVSPVCNTNVISQPFKTSTARTYPTVCNPSVISHPSRNNAATVSPVCITNVISQSKKTSTARTYPTACNSTMSNHSIKNNTARTHTSVCNTSMVGQPIRNSKAATHQSVSSAGMTTNKSSVQLSDSKPHTAETPKLERKRSSVGGFDTSLSDDLLCQLAEPDEVLDSQSDITVTVIPVTRVPTTSTYAPSTMSKSSYKSSVDNKHPVKQYTFKQSQKKSTSPVGNKQYNKLKETVPAASGIPVNKKEFGNVVDEYSEDLFASDDDDDMLLADDDGLTEPQILAMLDEVEMLATQQHSSQRSNQNLPSSVGGKGQNVGKTPILNNKQDFKTSQRQSVEKCEIFDHGTDIGKGAELSGSQGQLAGSQGQLVGSQGQLAGSQGQLAGSQGQLAGSQGHSSSQSKYSPAEIERKKQEAMERRKLKLKKV